MESRQGDVTFRPPLHTKDTPMSGAAHPRRRGSYGIDAPYWVAVFAVVIAANVVNAVLSGKVWLFLPVVFLLACASSCFYTTLRGKFVV